MAPAKAARGLTQQLSLAIRPKNFDDLLGQEKVVKAIRGQYETGRMKKGWLFTGPLGCGKTTLARILSVSLQCTHQEEGRWGRPCLACRRVKSSFPIYEINCGEVTGVEKLREVLEGAYYGVMGDGGYRVYILDEVHSMNDFAQRRLYKDLEDSPPTTIFILCSTDPERIHKPIVSRCLLYTLRGLKFDEITEYVTLLQEKIKCERPVDRLVDALVDKGVVYPRQIAQAVEKYAGGESAEDAALVEVVITLEAKNITRAIIAGDWAETAKWLSRSQDESMGAIRGSLVALLTTILLETSEVGSVRTDVVVKAITALTTMPNITAKQIRGALAATLYPLCIAFSKYRPGSK